MDIGPETCLLFCLSAHASSVWSVYMQVFSLSCLKRVSTLRTANPVSSFKCFSCTGKVRASVHDDAFKMSVVV